MTTRNIIINDIVDNITIYKNIHESFINFLKDEISSDYKPSFTFDEFCIMLLNNFDEVDENFYDVIKNSENKLINRMLKSLSIIAINEFKNDEKIKDKIIKLLEV